MKKVFIALFISLALIVLIIPIVSTKSKDVEDDSIKIVMVGNSYRNNDISMNIVYPVNEELLPLRETCITVRLRNFQLGKKNENKRSLEISNSLQGQSLHVFVDHYPYFNFTGPCNKSYDEEYWDEQCKITIPFRLKRGVHVVRILPCMSYGESVKSRGAYDACVFYIKDKDSSITYDLHNPYLTFNEPSSNFIYQDNQPILLDFIVSNCFLSESDYKILVTIDEEYQKILTKVSSYYIYGLKSGPHNIRLQLIDKNNKQVKGFFSEESKNITIQ